MIYNRRGPAGTILTVTAILIFFSVVLSCGTVSDSGITGGDVSSKPLYYGYGSGDSAIEAMNAAKKEAVKKAAADLLGRAAATAQEDQIKALFDGINDFNPYIYRDSQITLESSRNGGFYYTLGMRINLEVLAISLGAADIFGGQVDGRSDVEYRLSDQRPPAAGKKDNVQKGPDAAAGKSEMKPSEERPAKEVETPALEAASAEELAVIMDYIESLSYMVYFNEDTAADAFLMKSAVASANRFLDQNGYEYSDLAQIERIKEDQQMVYEEETGRAVSIMQWIAHKLNADIYIEISLDTSGRSEKGRHYGSANVSLNCFDASTGEGRGSAVYQTNPPAFSTVSQEDAISNAVSSAVFKAMGSAVKEVESEAARAALQGFKYKLTLINTEDSRTIREFEKGLERRTKNVKRLSYSPEESVFEVFLIGDIVDLEDLVYDTVESIPGMGGIMLVIQQRNSITFDTGM